jgi:hypothetical protein
MSRLVLAAAVVCVTAVGSLAQQTTTSQETKTFEVLAVDGNQLVVRLPEGTRELTVPDDFRFTVNGQPLSVRELQVGMKGTATITTRTTVTPVTVTEVKNGTVMQSAGSTIIVRTDEGIRSFSQGDVDKRGVTIMREGKAARVSDFRTGDRLSATIITSMPPRVITEKDVQATLAATTAAGDARPAEAASAVSAPVAAAPAASTPAAAAPAASAPVAAAPLPSAPAGETAAVQAPAAPAAATATPSETASAWPWLGLATLLAIVVGLALFVRRRVVR